MEITAPSHWRCIDFLSDIHLDASEPETFALWSAYMATTEADAIFILGDLFEVWVGDDVLVTPGSFEHKAVDVICAASTRAQLYIMVGNRDFLMGPSLMVQCGATALSDPSTLTFGGQRFVLSHGDALCLADTEYQAFRSMVRSPGWQEEFLAKPLKERQSIAKSIRAQSEHKKRGGTDYADVDPQAAAGLLQSLRASTLIHGHTHKPGEERLSDERKRIVLSDWVANAKPPRADVIRLSAVAGDSLTVSRLSPYSIAKAGD